MQVVSIDVAQGHAQESQSGLAVLHPRIWGCFHPARSGGRPRTAAVVIHPTSNFMGHYLLQPLAQAGVAALGLNTRYLGSDVSLLLERAIQDLGAGVRWLRAQGFERVVLIGNSGGAALVSLYQSQAEQLDITHTPAGDPVDLQPWQLPPADAIVLSAAHQGRSQLMSQWIDPAVVDENDPLATDPALDLFHPDNAPPYTDAFLQRYRAAQQARLVRLETWARDRLARLRSSEVGLQDMAFVVHRTLADPRCLDPSLDANDRLPGTTVWGPPRQQNYAANSMGRYTSLTSFLSQWAPCSRGDGPSCLSRTTVPVLLAEHTADASTFPSDHEAWARAAAGRLRRLPLRGGTHYLTGQPALVQQLVGEIAAFAATV